MLFAVTLPSWLIDEKYLTLATWGLVTATLLLVVATFIMWFDSQTKGKEQRERWAREDEAAKDACEPKCRFGFIRTADFKTAGVQRVEEDDHIVLWVANLGVYPLHVRSLNVSWANEEKKSLDINRLVRSGGRIRVHIPNSFWDVAIMAEQTAEISLLMSDPFSDFETEHLLYDLCVSSSNGVLILKAGTAIESNFFCPKCKERVAAFLDRTDAKTLKEYTVRFLKEINADLVKTCPNHASHRLNFLKD